MQMIYDTCVFALIDLKALSSRWKALRHASASERDVKSLPAAHWQELRYYGLVVSYNVQLQSYLHFQSCLGIDDNIRSREWK